MTTQTAAVTLTSEAAYTALSSGQATVLIESRSGRLRIHIGQTLPDAATDNWFPLEDGEPMHFQGLGASDNVYAKMDAPATETSTPAYPTRVHILRR
jgi:hypothetical protein